MDVSRGTVGDLSENRGEFGVEWRIEDFISLSAQVSEFYPSPVFSFAGASWCLRIYPNDDIAVSSQIMNTEGNISLYLCRESYGPPIHLQYSLGFKTLDGEVDGETLITDSFHNTNAYGYFRYISRSELLKRKLLPSGVLTVVCKIKYPKTADISNNTATEKCFYCKSNLDAHEDLSFHQQKCMDKPIKCPECSDVVALKDWYGHECQKAGAEEESKATSTEEVNNNKDDQLDVVRSSESEATGSNDTRATETEEPVSLINLSEDYGVVTDINSLLKEGRGLDVTFEVETPCGKREFFAHQLILTVMSLHFADEFYSRGSNKGHQVIPLKGIDPKTFEKMLRYCYGEVPILGTTEDACVLLKVASKFKVTGLLNLCCNFLRHTEIDPRNVFCILTISEEMEEKDLGGMCYKILQEKTREVMASYEPCDINPDMVHTILHLPKLSLNSENELINWIFDWAKVKSEEKDSICISTREYLEKLLQHMNFLALTTKEFAKLCKDNPEFFNSDERASVYQNIALPGSIELPNWYNKDLKCRVYTGSNE